MFDKTDREIVAQGQGTVIGSNVKLVGALRDSNDIVIHGVIEGEVGSEKSVAVGETAEVKGPIRGTVVSVAGTVNGSVEASQRLEVHPTGKIYGDVSVADLVIHSGAVFVGKCQMATNGSERRERKVESEPVIAKEQAKAGGKTNYEVE